MSHLHAPSIMIIAHVLRQKAEFGYARIINSVNDENMCFDNNLNIF